MRMKTFVAIVGAIVIGIFSPILSRAEETESKLLTVDTSVGFFSDYMFRGFNLYDGMSIQPSMNLNVNTDYGTLTGGLWMHLSGEGDAHHNGFTELDETLKYSNQIGPVAFSVGNVWYTYPEDGDEIKDSAEVFATASLDTFLTPTLSFYHDWKEFDAQYYELGFSHELKCDSLGEGFNITPFVAFGFASSAQGVYEDDGLVQITYGTSFKLALGDIAVGPSLNYTSGIDDATHSEFWAGTTFSYSF